MLSIKLPGKVYPVSDTIVETDTGAEIEEYNYDGRLVFRGNLDPDHSTEPVQVYWLYDDASRRVGVAEHSSDTDFAVLWYRDNAFSTLLQEEWVAQDKTIWSLMSQPAYEDCMRYGWTTIDALRTRTSMTLVTPNDLVHTRPAVHACQVCRESPGPSCTARESRQELNPYTTVFVDEDGVLYAPPSDSKVFGGRRGHGLQLGAGGTDK